MLVLTVPATAQNCPTPPPSITSSTPPVDVTSTGSNCNPITDFDDFSWRMFVAMIWPALQGQRGVPDTTKSNFPVSGPLVFETYKADWESFPPPTAPNPPPAPSPWADFAGTQNPCGQYTSAGWGDLVLASYTKFGNLGLAGFGPFLIGPLIAQNQTYVRYLASYNQTEYTQMLNQKLYLQANLGNVTFCSNGATVNGNQCPAENSIDLKSAWMDMTGMPAATMSRYYTKTAYVLDPATNACSQKTMGLVGLHIVAKTPSRPQWIWSTFEQVDNVPPIGSKPPYTQKFNFNDGTGTPMPAQSPYCVTGQNGCPPATPPPSPMPPTAPAPFNVQRIMPIGINPQSTPATNTAYQNLLKTAAPNSPWQFYQLVMTQWPVPGTPPPNTNPGSPLFTFPGTGATSSFSNVTLETFDQVKVGTGCMNCHNATAHPGGAANGNDFLWSLAVNAWAPPTVAPHGALALGKPRLADSTLASFKSLKGLLDSAVTTNKAMLKSAEAKAKKKKAEKPQ
jgi:hypothetical protein